MIFEFTIYPDFFIIFVGLVLLIQFSLIYWLDRKMRMLSEVKKQIKKPKKKVDPEEQTFK